MKPSCKVGFVFYLEEEGKVLVVSHSEDLSQTISLILKVRWPELSLVPAAEARQGLELIHREQPDIVMLHLYSATPDCFDLISQIRSFSDVPLIVLSQSDDVVDKIRALEMGADNWITPSSLPMEFIARVTAILRCCSANAKEQVASFLGGKLSINCATHEVLVSGRPVKLTPIEYRILCQLVRNEGSIVSRADLVQTVWGPNYGAGSEFVKKYVYRLRSKIEQDPANPKNHSHLNGCGLHLRRSPKFCNLISTS